MPKGSPKNGDRQAQNMFRAMALPALNGYHATSTDDKADPGDTERVWATLPKSLVAELDNFHFGGRYKNRSAAVKKLIEVGLQAQGWPKAKPDA